MDNKEQHTSTVLLIDDDPGIHKCLAVILQPDFSVHKAFCGKEGIEKAGLVCPDLILLDLHMSPMSGIEVLKRLMKSGSDIPIIVFTAYGSIDSAIMATKLGAVDYIEKPFNNLKLKQTLMDVLSKRRNPQKLLSHCNIIGESPQIQKVWQSIEKYGPIDLPIILQGETGTGKEMFANAIHKFSKRSSETFVPVDCSMIPETLFESELFGYEKGAFTGADIRKPGQLDWADKGTFFLDEISNLSLLYQAKLLRVIQEQQYVPLGSKVAKKIDVRFVSSTNVNLKDAVEHGCFREDLYYRICGAYIELPPLREREGDVELLVRHFTEEYARRYEKPHLQISDGAMELLLSYTWPGNVRELKHAIGAAVASANPQAMLAEDLPANLWNGIAISKHSNRGRLELELQFSCDITHPIELKKFKREIAEKAGDSIISEVKRRSSMNQMDLAKFLSIDPRTLRMRREYRSDNSHSR